MRVVDREKILTAGEAAARVELIRLVVLQQPVARRGEIALARLLRQAKLRLVATETFRLRRLELDEQHARAAIPKDRRELLDERVVRRVIECPNVHEDQPGQIARRDFLEQSATKLADETLVGRRAEWKEADHHFHHVVIREESESRAARELVADGHLADGRRSDDEDECRHNY